MYLTAVPPPPSIIEFSHAWGNKWEKGGEMGIVFFRERENDAVYLSR
jgi:hypothetical protein